MAISTEVPSTLSIAPTSGNTSAVFPALGMDRSSAQIVIETVTLVLLWVASVLGNVLVCIVVYRSRRLQSTTNYFVVSLACSDLLLAFLCMPFVLGRVVTNRWVFGGPMCSVVRFLQFTCPGATVYVLLSIAIDRFYTIIYPLSFKVSRTKAKQMIVLAWFFSALLAAPCFYFFQTEVFSQKTLCPTYYPGDWRGGLYVAAVFAVDYLVPIVLIILLYMRVVKHIWTIGVGGRKLQRTKNTVPATKVKTIKMLLLVNAVYLLTWSPFFLLHLGHVIAAVGGGGAHARGGDDADPTWFIAIVWIGFSSSVSNPLIYWVCNPNFRRGCREIFCMSSMKCYRSNTYAITYTTPFGKRNHVGFALDTNVTTAATTAAGSAAETTAQPQNGHVTTSFDREAKREKKIAWPLVSNGANTYL
ncbi:GPR19 [Branchiostoma lanceolatum]|uniref:Probable G-protein coupled receptor 19 n=1 Tax=Branchiostoma lanceolatum TaxID=7740 RepID=A0A8K0ELQ4_BRALA|nr:GPR19 [Branchiostoma lanceolatum]